MNRFFAIAMLTACFLAPSLLLAHDGPAKECYIASINSEGGAVLTPKVCAPDLSQPTKHYTADKAWWLVNLTSWVATVADIENTQAVLRAGGQEGNPIYGSHPSRLRAYAIAAPLAGLTSWVSYRWKREDDHDKAVLGRVAKVRWYASPLVNAGTHGFGIAFTLAATGR
jgi:hypothetical protein